MDRFEGRPSPLDIVADSVDHGVRTIDCRAHRRLIPDVGVYRGDQPGRAAPGRKHSALGMTHRDAHGGTIPGQALNNLTTEKARAAKHGNLAVGPVECPRHDGRKAITSEATQGEAGSSSQVCSGYPGNC